MKFCLPILCAAALLGQGTKVTIGNLNKLPASQPDKKIAYGPDPHQFGELRLPKGKGPHPVIVVIHGGCWGDFADATYMTNLCTRLADAGAATWNIEYRLAHQPGGGWPGTIHDAGLAIDHLRKIARTNSLDLRRVVTTGHSAGGHLALWAAGRKHISKSSPLYTARPLPIAATVPIAGIVDLDAFSTYGLDVCGKFQETTLGGVPKDVPDHYRAASPLYLLPTGVPQTLLFGDMDRNVPGRLFEAYVSQGKAKGDRIEVINVPDAAHFEFLMPGTAAEKILFDTLMRAVRLK